MTTITAPKVRPRRLTQPERSAATRKALLDSTIECLTELGFDRATTNEISERAGLSRGAHLHHFQTRATLLNAAVEELFNRGSEQLTQGVDRLPEGPERAGAALDMVWELFSGQLFPAMLELALHARSDPALRVEVDLLERMFGEDGLPLLRRALGRGSRDRSLDPVITMILATMRGLALVPILEPNRHPARLWRACRGQLLELLDPHL